MKSICLTRGNSALIPETAILNKNKQNCDQRKSNKSSVVGCKKPIIWSEDTALYKALTAFLLQR